jgi:transcriptional regulator with XRE-family HTH domain
MIESTEWTPQRVRRLRGKRTQAEFGQLVRVPKNTIWRWEAGYAKPDAERAARLSRLAKKERFLEQWKLAGSAELLGDIEEGSKILREQFQLARQRSLQQS